MMDIGQPITGRTEADGRRKRRAGRTGRCRCSGGAKIPGHFQVLPTTDSARHSPEIRATSEEMRLRVKAR